MPSNVQYKCPLLQSPGRPEGQREGVLLQDNAAGSFFQLLVQLLKVELHLALRDALEPDAPVPSTLDSMPISSTPHAPPADVALASSASATHANGTAGHEEEEGEEAEIGILPGLRNVNLDGGAAVQEPAVSGAGQHEGGRQPSSSDAGSIYFHL